jgi:hypothetical protein
MTYGNLSISERIADLQAHIATPGVVTNAQC